MTNVWALARPPLLHFNRLIHALLVQRGAPDLVGRLMFGAAEAERGAEAEIEVAGVLQ